MVDHLISDAMADAFDITIRREPVDVAALVTEVTETNMPSAVNKQQTISVSAPPNFVTMCDADRIREAIDNLVSNAIKYSPIGGKITVGVAHEGPSTRDPHFRPGRGPVAGGPRPPVRPLPAAVGQADRRRKLDRARPVDRQAHHRHAWRPCDRAEPGARTGLDLYDYIAARQQRVMTQNQHIIIVDDEAPAREMVGDYLKMHGFDVTLCDGGKSLRGAIESGVPDLVVLDLNMPEEDGLSIIRDLKSRINVPVIMLTATASPIDRVVGLELGADDYVAKPCELRELMARIRSVLRRSTAKAPADAGGGSAKAAKDQLVRFGTKWLDLEAQTLRDDEGNEHPLTASEFGLLKVFAANPKRVLSRERLLELANARDAEAFDRAIDLRIMRIRRKIEIDPSQAGGDPHHPRRRLPVLADRRQGLIHPRKPGLDAFGIESVRIAACLTASNFPHIEIIHFFAPNVSSQAPRRNNSFARETIFCFWRRHPETRVNYQFSQRNAAKRRELGACQCRTSSPSTPQPRSTSPLRVRHRTRCCSQRSPRAAAPRCMCFIPGTTFGSIASCCASCATPRWQKTSSARCFWMSGGPPASSRAARRSRPGCCRSPVSRR